MNIKIYFNILEAMNEEQVIMDLQTQVKPYVGTPISQPTFSNNIIRFKAGILKPNTLKSFLEKLGYVKTQEGWVKS